MKLLSIIIIFFVVNTLYAKTATICKQTYYDKSKKHIKTIQNFQNEKLDGEYYIYYKNGNVKVKALYVKGREVYADYFSEDAKKIDKTTAYFRYIKKSFSNNMLIKDTSKYIKTISDITLIRKSITLDLVAPNNYNKNTMKIQKLYKQKCKNTLSLMKKRRHLNKQSLNYLYAMLLKNEIEYKDIHRRYRTDLIKYIIFKHNNLPVYTKLFLFLNDIKDKEEGLDLVFVKYIVKNIQTQENLTYKDSNKILSILLKYNQIKEYKNLSEYFSSIFEDKVSKIRYKLQSGDIGGANSIANTIKLGRYGNIIILTHLLANDEKNAMIKLKDNVEVNKYRPLLNSYYKDIKILQIIYPRKKEILERFKYTLLNYTSTKTVYKDKTKTGLKNGLNYHEFDASSNKIALVVNVGSKHEKEDERGYAHFIEHLAFESIADDSTTSSDFMKELGMDSAKHSNAYTTEDKTYYFFNLPEYVSVDKRKKILKYLFNYASKANFSDEVVEKERKIILEELRKNTNDNYKDYLKKMSSLFGDSNTFYKVGGTDETIKNATSLKLKQFYKKWYVPKNMYIINAKGGSFKNKNVSEYAKKLFSRLDKKQLPKYEKIKLKQKSNFLYIYKNEDMNTVSFSYITKENKIENMSQHRKNLLQRISLKILKDKLNLFFNDSNTFLNINVDNERIVSNYKFINIDITSTISAKKIIKKFSLLMSNIKKYGVVDDDIQKLKYQYIKSLQSFDITADEGLENIMNIYDFKQINDFKDNKQRAEYESKLLETITKKDVDLYIKNIINSIDTYIVRGKKSISLATIKSLMRYEKEDRNLFPNKYKNIELENTLTYLEPQEKYYTNKNIYEWIYPNGAKVYFLHHGNANSVISSIYTDKLLSITREALLESCNKVSRFSKYKNNGIEIDLNAYDTTASGINNSLLFDEKLFKLIYLKHTQKNLQTKTYKKTIDFLKLVDSSMKNDKSIRYQFMQTIGMTHNYPSLSRMGHYSKDKLEEEYRKIKGDISNYIFIIRSKSNPSMIKKMASKYIANIKPMQIVPKDYKISYIDANITKVIKGNQRGKTSLTLTFHKPYMKKYLDYKINPYRELLSNYLYESIREESQLVYGADVEITNSIVRDRLIVNIKVDMKSKNKYEVIKLIHKAISSLKNTKISKAKLKNLSSTLLQKFHEDAQYSVLGIYYNVKYGSDKIRTYYKKLTQKQILTGFNEIFKDTYTYELSFK